MFSSSGSFLKAKQKQVTKANKAIYEVLKKGRLHNLSIQCQLELFDRIIQPILLYGCEVWGFSNNAIVERVHLKFCKLLLHLKPSTPDFMIYGELGRYPMDIQIKTRMISYWSNLINGKQTKIAAMLYKLSAITNEEVSGKFKWIEYIKNTLNNCGLSNIWHCLYQVNPEWLRQKIKLTLTDQFKQSWYALVENSPKALNYRIFKESPNFENYLNFLPKRDAITFCRFRLGNHHLPIERGRWNNIERGDRICEKCMRRDIGDEFHYILNCDNLNNERKICLPAKYINNRNIITFNNIMTSKKQSFVKKLCTFIRQINKLCSPNQ